MDEHREQGPGPLGAIRSERERLGLTRLEASRELGVTELTFARWEAGQRGAREASLAEILAALKRCARRGRRKAGARRRGAATGPKEPAARAATGAELREAREALGLSRAEAARILGVTAASVSNWERGRSTPRSAPLSELIGRLEMASPRPPAASP